MEEVGSQMRGSDRKIHFQYSEASIRGSGILNRFWWEHVSFRFSSGRAQPPLPFFLLLFGVVR